MFDIVSQVAVFVLGSLAIVLVAKKNKWGFVVGLMSQPFWYVTSYLNEQWGVFFVSFVYTVSWSLGIYEWFFKNNVSQVMDSSTGLQVGGDLIINKEKVNE